MGALTESAMGWFIGRAEAISDPLAARLKVMTRLRGLAELDDPEGVVVPILVDAILMVESYRGARHQITLHVCDRLLAASLPGTDIRLLS